MLGMVLGAAIDADIYPAMKVTVLAWRDFGKIGLPESLGVSPSVVIPIFWAGTLGCFAGLEKRGL